MPPELVQVPVIALANSIVLRQIEKERPITQMQLQKLVSIVQGYHLGFFMQPLFLEEIQAWKHGPVVPEVYSAFRTHGAEPIDGPALDIFSPGSAYPVLDEFGLTKRQFELIDSVLDHYAGKSAATLRAITHLPRTPWAQVTANGEDIGESKVIPHSVIESYYSGLIKVNGKQD